MNSRTGVCEKPIPPTRPRRGRLGVRPIRRQARRQSRRSDDRTAAVAESATALSGAGQALLLDTGHFVEDSLAQGSVDPVAAAELRGKYQLLKDQADDLEVRLEELRSMFPHEVIEPHVGPLLGQIHAIKARLKAVIQLLSLLARHG